MGWSVSVCLFFNHQRPTGLIGMTVFNRNNIIVLTDLIKHKLIFVSIFQTLWYFKMAAIIMTSLHV